MNGQNLSLIVASERFSENVIEELRAKSSTPEVQDMVPKDQHGLDQRAVEIFSSALGEPLAVSLLHKECLKLGFGLENLNETQLVILIKDIEPLIDAMVGELLSCQIIAKLRRLIIYKNEPSEITETIREYLQQNQQI